MNGTDRVLQAMRISQALRWIPPESHLLDVGCADGALFRKATSRVKSGIGVDTEVPSGWPSGPYEFRHGPFPDVVQGEGPFDAVTMLAVIEHVPDDVRKDWVEAIPTLLKPGGRLIITVPAPLVDRILEVGIWLHILHGMDAESHHGFDPDQVPEEFGIPPLRLVRASRFELGLNHLFVFDRT